MAEWGGVKGKRVLITGATNGIGLAGAEELARRGASLAIVARDEAKAADTAAPLRAPAASAPGRPAAALPGLPESGLRVPGLRRSPGRAVGPDRQAGSGA